MKRVLLIVLCVACIVLCACTPHNGENAEPTTAPTEPRPTPAPTIITPTETAGEYIDVVDPTDSSVVVPLETPSSSSAGNDTVEPAPTPSATPSPTPAPTLDDIKSDNDLPFVPIDSP